MNQRAVCRPFIDTLDADHTRMTEELDFYSDLSRNLKLEMGAVFNDRWIFAQWEPQFIDQCQPSIAYLELYTLCAAILAWQDRLTDMRMVVFCDNLSVRQIVNSLTSSGKNCMYLLRLLTLNNLIFNRRVFINYIESKRNDRADALSRMKFSYFRRIAPHMRKYPDKMPNEIWPVSRIWQL